MFFINARFSPVWSSQFLIKYKQWSPVMQSNSFEIKTIEHWHCSDFKITLSYKNHSHLKAFDAKKLILRLFTIAKVTFTTVREEVNCKYKNFMRWVQALLIIRKIYFFLVNSIVKRWRTWFKSIVIRIILLAINWSSLQGCSIKKLFKNLAVFTEKHLYRSLFLIKLQAFRAATLLKRDFNKGASLWILQKFKNTYFKEHLQTAASVWMLMNWLLKLAGLQTVICNRVVTRRYINPFVPNAPFLYPLKTSENLTVLTIPKLSSYRNQSDDFHCKSVDWFLYDTIFSV